MTYQAQQTKEREQPPHMCPVRRVDIQCCNGNSSQYQVTKPNHVCVRGPENRELPTVPMASAQLSSCC